MVTFVVAITCIVTFCLFWMEVIVGLVCGFVSLIVGLIFKILTTWWGWMLIFFGIALALCL